MELELYNLTNNFTNITDSWTPNTNRWWLNAPYGRIQIPLYATIFLLAVGGNSLVILTLSHHQRMRTITNVFLLNLAVSDLLLGVLCMPFTLVGTLLRDFVFGEFMCKCLPYLQGKLKFILILKWFTGFYLFRKLLGTPNFIWTNQTNSDSRKEYSNLK